MKDLQDEVLKLASNVPAPPGYELPKGATLEEIRDFEMRSRVILPPPLRDWLRTTNGPVIGPGGVFGIGTTRRDLDIQNVLAQFPAWKQHGWIPIAGDGSGNYYVLTEQPNRGHDHVVLFIDTHEDPDKPAYIVASNLWLFLYFLFSRELGDKAWPFDAEKVIATDSELRHHDNFRMPWD